MVATDKITVETRCRYEVNGAWAPDAGCVLSKKYGLSGLAINTGAGVVTPASIGALVPLIDKGIR